MNLRLLLALIVSLVLPLHCSDTPLLNSNLGGDASDESESSEEEEEGDSDGNDDSDDDDEDSDDDPKDDDDEDSEDDDNQTNNNDENDKDNANDNDGEDDENVDNNKQEENDKSLTENSNNADDDNIDDEENTVDDEEDESNNSQIDDGDDNDDGPNDNNGNDDENDDDENNDDGPNDNNGNDDENDDDENNDDGPSDNNGDNADDETSDDDAEDDGEDTENDEETGDDETEDDNGNNNDGCQYQCAWNNDDCTWNYNGQVVSGTCDNPDQVCCQVGGQQDTGNPDTGNPDTGNPDTGNQDTGGGEDFGNEQAPPRLSNGQRGFASRYWDCCKAHCGWPENSNPAMQSCDMNNNPVSADTQSACSGGSAHTCWSFAPWAAGENIAYGFAAVPVQGDVCGKCYQLDFTGEGHYGTMPGGSQISNKTMIVQATNVGGDVAGGQFDVLIPGGGVGAFNACSNQWGTQDLGAQYGGFYTACEESLGYEASLQQYKDCVKQHCNRVFGDKSELMAGCDWFVDWLHVANNPVVNYAEVSCPAALTNKSGIY